MDIWSTLEAFWILGKFSSIGTQVVLFAILAYVLYLIAFKKDKKLPGWEHKFVTLTGTTEDREHQMNELAADGWEVLQWDGHSEIVIRRRKAVTKASAKSFNPPIKTRQ